MLIQCLEDIIQGSILALTPGKDSWEFLQGLDNIWQQMLVIPAQAAENDYVPLPWAVSHNTFGLFILEGWVAEWLSPWDTCLVMQFGCFLLTLLLWLNVGNFDCFPNVPSAPPPTLASILRMSVPYLRPAINHIGLSCLPFGSMEGHIWRSVHPWHASLQWIHVILQILTCIAFIIGFTSMRWGMGEVLFWTSAPLK